MTSRNKPAYPSEGRMNAPSGLTKRELIAAMVLQGFAADSSAGGTKAELAIQAVEWADSLMDALERAP